MCTRTNTMPDKPFLRRNVEMNWLGSRVIVNPKAAHRDDEERSLRDVLGSNGFVDIVEPAEGEAQPRQGDEFMVACERLDVALAEVPYVDLVRIAPSCDAASVLQGASRLFDDGRIGAISVTCRDEAQSRGRDEDLEKELTTLVRDRGATLHVPGAAQGRPTRRAADVLRLPATVGPDARSLYRAMSVSNVRVSRSGQPLWSWMWIQAVGS